MGSFNSTIPTFLAGELPDADKFTTVSDALTVATGAWTDYAASLTITGSTTSPTKGNSTYVARYNRLGKTVYYAFNITIGSSWSAGSGTYSFSLPVTAQASFLGIGTCKLLDGGVGHYTASAYLLGTTTLGIIKNGDANLLGSGGPGSAWATGDGILVSIVYEAA